MSNIVGNEPCPQCRKQGRDKTGNHLMRFKDGGAYCNRCQYTEAGSKVTDASNHKPKAASLLRHKADEKLAEILECTPAGLPLRGLTDEVMGLCGFRVGYDTATREPEEVYFPRHKDGKVVGWKIKNLNTGQYYSIGDSKESDLVGMDQDGGTRLVIITEGELDMAAMRQVLREHGKDWRVVSLPNGANASISKASFEFLSGFETIKIATDMDEKGEDVASKLTEMFPAGVCQRVSMPEKDANDCLVNGKGDELYNAVRSARTITADGVVLGEDTWDTVVTEYRRTDNVGTPYMDYLPLLNDMTYGPRRGDLDTFTSGTGSGKTQFLRELQYCMAISHGHKLGVMSLEEPMVDTALGQMSIHANIPLHLPDIRPHVSDADLRQYWEATYGTGRYAVYDHFGSLSEDTLISKIRYLAVAMGCTHIFLDHLSIVVSEYADEGDERKVIDQIMTKLKRLTQELNIWIGLVVHLRKSGGTPFELGAIPSLDDLRGSGSIKQLSNNVIALSRNQQHNDPVKRNTTMVTVLKSRLAGRTGPADLMFYDRETGRMMASTLSREEYLSVEPLLKKPTGA